MPNTRTFSPNEVFEIFAAAKDIVERFQSEQNKALVADALQGLEHVVTDVETMYNLAHDAAQHLVTSLMLVGQVILPDSLSADNEDAAADRGIVAMTEVTQFDELAMMLHRELA